MPATQPACARARFMERHPTLALAFRPFAKCAQWIRPDRTFEKALLEYPRPPLYAKTPGELALAEKIVNGTYDEAAQACFELWSKRRPYVDNPGCDLEFAARARSRRRATKGEAAGRLSIPELGNIIIGKAEAPSGIGCMLIGHLRPSDVEGITMRYVKDREGIHGANLFYQTQGLRNGISYGLGAPVSAFVTHEGRHPLRFIIFGPFADGCEKTIAKAAAALAELSRNDVAVKYLNKRQLAELISLGLKKGDRCQEDVIESDLNYPEVVLDVEEAISLKGSAYSKFRLGVNAFRNWARKNRVEVVCTTSGSDDFVVSIPLLDQWAADKASRAREQGKVIDEKYLAQAHRLLIWVPDELTRFTTPVKRSIRADGRMVAVSLLSPLGAGAAGLFVNITDTRIPGVSEFLVYDALSAARNWFGAKTLNLGGSESESLFRFKKKLGPSKELTWYYAVLSPPA